MPDRSFASAAALETEHEASARPKRLRGSRVVRPDRRVRGDEATVAALDAAAANLDVLERGVADAANGPDPLVQAFLIENLGRAIRRHTIEPAPPSVVDELRRLEHRAGPFLATPAPGTVAAGGPPGYRAGGGRSGDGLFAFLAGVVPGSDPASGVTPSRESSASAAPAAALDRAAPPPHPGPDEPSEQFPEPRPPTADPDTIDAFYRERIASSATDGELAHYARAHEEELCERGLAGAAHAHATWKATKLELAVQLGLLAAGEVALAGVGRLAGPLLRRMGGARSSTTAAAAISTAVPATKAPKIPGRVASRINISGKGWTHTVMGHLNPTLAARKSQFSITSSELRALLASRTTIASPVVRVLTNPRNANDVRYVREVAVHRPVGVDVRAGTTTSTMTVLTDPFGNLLTAFPGRL